MPIEPISIPGFARNPVGIESILERGSSAFSGILRDAVQVGRDQANNQASQERDFLTEQQRAINLSERRGENLQAQANNDRNFTQSEDHFSRTFGQSDEHFNASLKEANLDRVVREKGVDNSIKATNASITQGAEQTANAKERLAIDKEDQTFKRADRKDQKELFDVNLETAKLKRDEAKSAPEKAAAEKTHQEALGQAQSAILGNLGTLIDEGKIPEAKSYFNKVVEHPRYEVDDKTKQRFASQLGIKVTGTTEKTAAVPIDEMDLDAVNERIDQLNGASSANDDKPLSEARRLEAVDLNKRKAELMRGTSDKVKGLLDRYK